MVKFIATIEIRLEVEAESKEYAQGIIEVHQPFVNMTGVHVKHGFYSLKTKEGQRIVKIQKCPERRKEAPNEQG